MLQQGLFKGDWSALGATGALSIGISMMVALAWFLMQQGAFGVKTLYPGDQAIRTIFGRPVWYHKSPKSLLFIAMVFNVHVVTTKTIVHDSIPMTLDIKGSKRLLLVWIESQVQPTRKSVDQAIFALGDCVNSHLKGNKRTQRVEAIVREQLTKRAETADDWSNLNPIDVIKAANKVLLDENGTTVTAVRLTDTAPSEGQLIATPLSALRLP